MRIKDTFLSLLIIFNNKILLVKKSDEELYFLPGCKQIKKHEDEQLLKYQILKKYGLKCDINNYLGNYLISKDTRVKGYLSRTSNISLNDSNFILIDINDIAKMNISFDDRIFIQKYIHFYYLYNKCDNKVNYSEDEIKYINLYLDTLTFYKNQLNDIDILDFHQLVSNGVNLLIIQNAFKWLMKLYNLDYNNYFNILLKKCKTNKKEII